MRFSETSLQNNEIIKSLVTKHFSLSKESLDLFNKNLDNPEIKAIPEFEKIYNSPDYRHKIKINDKKTLVFSANFADWFLCATGETWTSSLSLTSEYSYCYWAGLPSFAVDKNRILCYVTDNTKKEVHGITVDRMINRNWLFLVKSKKDTFCFISKSYPRQIEFYDIFKSFILPSVFNGLKIIDRDPYYEDLLETIHPIPFLKHSNDAPLSAFIDSFSKTSINNSYYQLDNTGAAEKPQEWKIDKSVQDKTFLIKTRLYLTKGLKHLVEENDELINHFIVAEKIEIDPSKQEVKSYPSK